MEQKDIDIYEILKNEECGTVEWQTTRTVRKQSGLRTKLEENTFSTRTEKSIKKEKFCSSLRKK